MVAGERVAVFVATRSSAGQELLQRARSVVSRMGFTLETLIGPTQSQVFKAVVRCDVVILDATIEPGGGSSYPAFTAQPLAMDHVLVVSRTPLPLNFYGLREGGAPPYPEEFDNNILLNWLESQLQELRSINPRSRLERAALGSVLTFVKSLSSAPARERRAFISYRREALGGARELAARLMAGDAKIAPMVRR